LTVGVASQTGCTWTSESGNANVRITVEPNAGAARSATLTIAGSPFSLTQEAARR
jgi:hypothetical protein